MTTAAITIERPQREYDDMAFALMCLEHGLPRQLRRRAGLSQQALADRAGMPRMIVHTWEHGTAPRLHDMDMLARYGRELKRLARETGLVCM
jgi:DNA-binding XRE family transcriptional regulator